MSLLSTQLPTVNLFGTPGATAPATGAPAPTTSSAAPTATGLGQVRLFRGTRAATPVTPTVSTTAPTLGQSTALSRRLSGVPAFQQQQQQQQLQSQLQPQAQPQTLAPSQLSQFQQQQQQVPQSQFQAQPQFNQISQQQQPPPRLVTPQSTNAFLGAASQQQQQQTAQPQIAQNRRSLYPSQPQQYPAVSQTSPSSSAAFATQSRLQSRPPQPQPNPYYQPGYDNESDIEAVGNPFYGDLSALRAAQNAANLSAEELPPWELAANRVQFNTFGYEGGVGWPVPTDPTEGLASSHELDQREVQQSEDETRRVNERLRAVYGISDSDSATASVEEQPPWAYGTKGSVTLGSSGNNFLGNENSSNTVARDPPSASVNVTFSGSGSGGSGGSGGNAARAVTNGGFASVNRNGNGNENEIGSTGSAGVGNNVKNAPFIDGSSRRLSGRGTQSVTGSAFTSSAASTCVSAPPSKRTLDNIVLLDPPPAQIMPPQWYVVRILGNDYTVVRYSGMSESPALLALIDQARRSRGPRWTVEPVEIPVNPCVVGQLTPYPNRGVGAVAAAAAENVNINNNNNNGNNNVEGAREFEQLSGSRVPPGSPLGAALERARQNLAGSRRLSLGGADSASGMCATDREMQARLMRYTDALFVAFAYQIDALEGLDLDHITCFLRVASDNDLAVGSKAALQAIASATNTRDLAQVYFALDVLGQYEPFLTTRPEGKSTAYARVLTVAKQIIARAFDEHGFSPVALALLASPSPQSNPGWSDDLLVVLGSAVAQVTGLGSEPVTGALVESLLRPALRLVKSEDGAGAAEVASPIVQQAVSGASDYIANLRAQQASLTVDRAIAERIYYWTRSIGPLDIEIERTGTSIRERYRSLVIARKGPNGMLYYADSSPSGYVQQAGSAPSLPSIEPVGGIQSLLDDWSAITIRPYNAASAQALALAFAPAPEFRSLVQTSSSDSPYAFHIEKAQYVGAILGNSTLASHMTSTGVLQGISTQVG